MFRRLTAGIAAATLLGFAGLATAQSYYTASEFSRHTRARSEAINAEFQAIEAAFNKLPGVGRIAEGRTTHATDTGSADSYAIALDVTPTAYTAGMMVSFIPANTNTGASTINVDSLGARSIKQGDGTDPGAGDIVAGTPVELRYDGTNFVIMSQDIGATADAEASATAAAASAASAAASYDSFDDRYLGAKSSDPATDNDGNSLLTSALYWNTTTPEMRVYNGSSWEAVTEGDYDSSNVSITGGSISGTTIDLGTNTVTGTTSEFNTALSDSNFTFFSTTDVSTASWVLDEDTLSSDSSTKVPTQQSVKAYVDANAGLSIDTEIDLGAVGSTSHDFSVPSGVKAVYVLFKSVSTDGTAKYKIQLGDSGGVEASGYDSAVDDGTAAAPGNDGFYINNTVTSGDTASGIVTLRRWGTVEWVQKGTMSVNTGSGNVAVSGGSKAVTTELTTVRITADGVDSFDAGTVNIQYE